MRALVAAALAVSLPTIASAGDEAGAPDLRPYLRHAASAAAVASAVAMVEDCAAPLDFEPGGEGEFMTLTVSCRDILAEESAVVLVFRVHPVSGDTPWLEPVETRVTPAPRF